MGRLSAFYEQQNVFYLWRIAGLRRVNDAVLMELQDKARKTIKWRWKHNPDNPTRVVIGSEDSPYALRRVVGFPKVIA